MTKKIINLLFILLIFSLSLHGITYADQESRIEDFKVLNDINVGTFNEYGYKITEQFFKLKQDFEVNGIFQKETLNNLYKLSAEGYKHLPDNLNNQKYLSDLQSAIRRGLQTTNELIFIEISRAIEKYLYKTEIDKIKGNIEANPLNGNAPLNVTLRARVIDPSGTVIPKDNYVWWIDNAGKKKIIGKGLSINYTLNEEGKFSIFLDVLSDHRNTSNYIDVLPFRSRADITVGEKIANVNIKVNYTDLGNQSILKFSPEDGNYGIIFDATSSIPTSGSKFTKTTWDFGNSSSKREYEGPPKVERVQYPNKGDYTVKLKLRTNEGKEIERKFVLSLNNPIATINSSQEQGYIGDRFTFSAKSSTSEKNITYNWTIVDIDKNKTLLEKAGNLFTYEFLNKGKFNVKLKVTSPSGDIDYDNKIIYINSRAPYADFGYSIPNPSFPNKVMLDATKSYDEDYSDDGKLNYSWEVDGQKITLENPTLNGAIGYYTFDSIGDHSVVLEVTDPDSIKAVKKDRVKVNSILSVSFDAIPLAIKRDSSIDFEADSKEAKFYRWDFGDGNSEGTKSNKITHAFNKSGVFPVKLEVSDEIGNTNTFTRSVYVSDSQYPLALIDITYETGFSTPYDNSGCNGKGAYIVDRINNIKLSGLKSINTDGETNGITYSWKIGQENISSNSTLVKKFDEIGCIPVKLSVKSNKNDKIQTAEAFIEVRNILPTLSSINVQAVDTSTDPIIVNLKAVGEKDRDGVILSYLWYYYTDSDEEPQDYRVTTKGETTFVLPKISGTYYFVLILKDNNEEKFSSEELGTKFYVTLVGDNVNTPLVDLLVNDSSVSVGDSVEFTTKIKNILGQDLTSKTTYSWDFNGDGFYDKEIVGNGTIIHKFENSGTYHVKVKAKYKGISNVKSVTVDVVNVLVPDFDYISINNKFIFLNKSLGNYDDVSWDFGDGNIGDSKNSVNHTYYDGVSVHKVTLRISEGNKYKEVSKRVRKNTENIKKAYKKGLNIFSTPELTNSGQIILKDKNEKLFLYLGESKLDISKYAIDFDIEYDSDLNGGKSDDEDNKDTPSFRSGDPIEVNLNETTKKQTIRIKLLDINGKELAKSDIEVIKEYIIEEKTEKDIVFAGISKSDEEKINSLKNYIGKFPQNHRVVGMKYLERLKSEWFDETEKTKVILEFEGFVDNPEIPNSEEVINILESLLVSGEEDKSERNIAFSALKNLILKDIQCEYDTKNFKSCKEYLVSILEEIKNSNDINKNIELGNTVLEVIRKDAIMTDKEKIDFKEILKILINGKNSVETTVEVPVKEGFFSKVVSFLKMIAYIILFLILIIGLIILGFWLYFKFGFKDSNKTFEEFIIEKTKFKKSSNEIIEEVIDTTKENIDNKTILDPFSIDSNQTSNIEKKEEKVPDWLKASFEQNGSSDNNYDDKNTKKEEKIKVGSDLKEENQLKSEPENNIPINNIPEKTENDITKIDEPEIPDWLKGKSDNKKEINLSTNIEGIDNLDDKKIESSKTEEDLTKVDEPEIPDWLKGSIDNTTTSASNPDSNSNISDTQGQETSQISEYTPPLSEKTESDITKVDEPEIPDWLKGSIDNTTTSASDPDSNSNISDTQGQETSQISEYTPPLSEKTESDITKVDEPEIPDWLKGSIDSGSKKEIEDSNSFENKNSKKQTDNKNNNLNKKNDTGNQNNKINKKDNTPSKDGDELWDDGMEVPDWLNTKNDDK